MTDVNAENAELKAKIDALEAEKRTAQASFGATDSRVAALEGQISLLVNALQAPTGAEDQPGDIVADTKGVLDAFWKQRAAPLIDASTRQAATTNKELLALKRADDWKEFGPRVEMLIKEKGISDSTLAQAGSLESLLDLVKSKHTDEIVKRKVEAEVAAFQAKAAMASAPAQSAAAGPTGTEGEVKFSDRQTTILGKLGVDPKRAAEVMKNTTTDGFRIMGEVNS